MTALAWKTATFARQGLAKMVALVKRSREPGALSAVVGPATREELVKMPGSSVLLESATKGVVRISAMKVLSAFVQQGILGKDAKKVCWSS